MSIARPPIRLLVCGNIDRCDDGAAIWAVGHLLPGTALDELPGVSVMRCDQLNVENLIDDATGAPILLVDTAVGVRPGAVVTLTFDELLARPKNGAPHSSHALPIDQVIGVSRQLASSPIDGLLVGIGAANVGFGQTLSRPVREQIGEFVVAIHRALMRLASCSAASTGAHR